MNIFYDVNEDAKNNWLDDVNKTHEPKKRKKNNSIDCKQMRWRLNGFQECWLHFYVCVFDVLANEYSNSHFSCVANFGSLSLAAASCCCCCCHFVVLCSRHNRPGAELHVCMSDSFDFWVVYHAVVCAHTSGGREHSNPNTQHSTIWMYRIANVCTLYMQCTHTRIHGAVTMLF